MTFRLTVTTYSRDGKREIHRAVVDHVYRTYQAAREAAKAFPLKDCQAITIEQEGPNGVESAGYARMTDFAY